MLRAALPAAVRPPFPSGPCVPPGAPYQNTLGAVPQDPDASEPPRPESQSDGFPENWGPGGTQGPLGKGGAAERWRVTPSVSGVTRHGAQPATTRTHKRNASAASGANYAFAKGSAPPTGDHKLIPKFFCFLLQEQKEGLRGERCKPSPSGDSAPPLGDNILAPFTQNSLDLSPLLRYNYIEIFI